MKQISIKQRKWESFEKDGKKYIISKSTRDGTWKIIHFKGYDIKPDIWRGFKTKKDAKLALQRL